MEMTDKAIDKVITKFFIERAQSKVYQWFMDDLHGAFEQMVEEFKVFSKREYDSRTAHLQKTMYGDPKQLEDESVTLQWNFDQILPELIKMNATLQAAKLKEHTDMMLKVAESSKTD